MNESIYEVTPNELGGEFISRTDPDGKVWSIPTDPNNSDYQEYLAWLEEQNNAD